MGNNQAGFKVIYLARINTLFMNWKIALGCLEVQMLMPQIQCKYTEGIKTNKMLCVWILKLHWNENWNSTHTDSQQHF